MKTGLVFHELYLWHHTGNHADYIPYGYPVEPLNHSESPDAKRRIKNLLEVSGLYEKLFKISPRQAATIIVQQVVGGNEKYSDCVEYLGDLYPKNIQKNARIKLNRSQN